MSTLINEKEFIRKYTTYKFQKLNHLVSLEDIKFPYFSVFHLLDNFDSKNSIDKYRKDYYGFLQNKDFIKKSDAILYHNKFLNIHLLKEIKVKGRYISTELNKTLGIYKKNEDNLKLVLNRTSLQRYVKRKEILVIVNHNPIYSRTIVFPKSPYLKMYYKFLVMFKALNTFIYNISNNNPNFIFIPLNTNEVVPMNIYSAIIKSQQIKPIYFQKYKSQLFFLLSNILLYSFSDSNKSIFNTKINQEKLYFVFFNPKTQDSFISNLNTLKNIFNSMSNSWKRFIYNVYSNIDSTITENLEIPGSDNEKGLEIENPNLAEPFDTDYVTKITEKNKPSIEKKSPPFIDSVNNTFDEFVKKNTTLNSSQVHRLKILIDRGINSKVTIDGKEVIIKDIIDREIDPSIDVIDVKDKLDKTVMDLSYGENNVNNFHKNYMEKYFYHDLFKNLISFSKVGLIFRKYEEENEINDLTLVKHIRVTFTNIDGKTKVLKFKIPIIDSNGNFRYNGVKSFMKLQFTNLPIVKIDSFRVSLTSNYGKTIIERVKSFRTNLSNFIIKKIKEHNKTSSDKITYKLRSYGFQEKLPFEYTSIGNTIREINSPYGYLTFEYDKRFKILELNEKEGKKLEENFGVLIGKKDNRFLFMGFSNVISEIDITNKEVINKNFIFDYIFEGNIKNIPVDWINVLILDKRLPLIFILGYKFGLNFILNELKIPYRTVQKGKRVKLNQYEIGIKFKDVTLVIPRYPLTSRWIVSGLLSFPSLIDYDFNDLNIPDIYYELIENKGLSINYLKGIDNFFNFFIDPITEDTLRMLNEPTTPKELLYRAVELLETEQFDEPSSIKNFKIRGLEKINGIVYNEIGRQYAQYLNDKSKNTVFTINTEAVIMKILQDQSVSLVEETNPIHYLKEKTSITYGGFLGRKTQAFVDKDRKYPEDGIGIISEAVPDNKKVGYNSYTPLNISIKNSRGLLKSVKNVDDLGSGNILSISGALMPFSINDDAKRLVFINIQLSHHVPTVNGKPTRVRTGLESVIGDYSNPLYATIAKDSGIVEDIDTRQKRFRVKYKTLGTYVYEYGNISGEVSSFMINHSIVLNNITPGKRIKKGDVLAYNEGFFKLDPVFNQLNWCHGVSAKIAIADNKYTLEDSCAFTKNFLNKLNFNSIYPRAIKITPDLVLNNMKQIGDIVDYNSKLVELEYEDIRNIDIDEIDKERDSDDIISTLNKIHIKAKYKGSIQNIRMFHTLPIEEYHPSIQKILRKYYREEVNNLKRFGKNATNQEDVNIQPFVTPGIRLKKYSLNEGDLLILFFIKTSIGVSIGDKLVIDNSLKTVIGEIFYHDLETKSGIKIDGIFGGKSVFDRIITSPIKLGILEQILEKIETNAIDMYFK